MVLRGKNGTQQESLVQKIRDKEVKTSIIVNGHFLSLTFCSQSYKLYVSTPNNGDNMKIGSVVENPFGDIGIVIKQIGVADRWLIQWASGEVYGINGYQLEVIA